MRLWSLHPSYLDTKGLVACWREGLLARTVLEGKTAGYRNHPQLVRFKAQSDPLAALDQYLSAILEEAERRGYAFNPAKIGKQTESFVIPVTEGQLRYELEHLKGKLRLRDFSRYKSLCHETTPVPHPLFCIVQGGIEAWEKVG